MNKLLIVCLLIAVVMLCLPVAGIAHERPWLPEDRAAMFPTKTATPTPTQTIMQFLEAVPQATLQPQVFLGVEPEVWIVDPYPPPVAPVRETARPTYTPNAWDLDLIKQWCSTPMPALDGYCNRTPVPYPAP